MKYGLKSSTLQGIQNTLLQFSQIEEVILYGSRAMGNFKPGSDIDLAIIGKNLSHSKINQISLKLDDLNLPYTFDICDFSKINNKDLINHILNAGILFYKRKEVETAPN
ncbi:MAG: nucleotidyltransferase domain-containing protein [Saprospiraceae bacterium]